MALGALEARSFTASRTSRAACLRWVRSSGGVWIMNLISQGRRSTRWRVDTKTKCIILRRVMMTSCIPCVHRYCQHIPLASGLGRTLDQTQTLERSEAQIPQPLLFRFFVSPAQHHVTHLILPCLCYLSRFTMHNMQLSNANSRLLWCLLTTSTT